MNEVNWKEQALHLATTTTISWRAIAKQLGVPKSTVSDFLREATKTVAKAQQGAKILVFDVESSPTMGWVWGRFKQFLQQSQVISETYLLSYAAKWLDNDKMISSILTPFEVKEEDDSRIIGELLELLDEADIVVAHNGRQFDVKLFKARALFWGFSPPSSFKIEDTLEIAKREFRLPSNKLDSIGEYLGVGRKTPHSGFSLWRGVLEHDVESRRIMLEYNEQDVHLLEAIYLKLRMWDSKAVNKAQYYSDDKVRCVSCGSEHVAPSGKIVHSPVNSFEEMVCGDCGHISRSRQTVLTKEKRKSILANIG